jgi:hypothetical protein
MTVKRNGLYVMYPHNLQAFQYIQQTDLYIILYLHNFSLTYYESVQASQYIECLCTRVPKFDPHHKQEFFSG